MRVVDVHVERRDVEGIDGRQPDVAGGVTAAGIHVGQQLRPALDLDLRRERIALLLERCRGIERDAAGVADRHVQEVVSRGDHDTGIHRDRLRSEADVVPAGADVALDLDRVVPLAAVDHEPGVHRQLLDDERLAREPVVPAVDDECNRRIAIPGGRRRSGLFDHQFAGPRIAAERDGGAGPLRVVGAGRNARRVGDGFRRSGEARV